MLLLYVFEKSLVGPIQRKKISAVMVEHETFFLLALWFSGRAAEWGLS